MSRLMLEECSECGCYAMTVIDEAMKIMALAQS